MAKIESILNIIGDVYSQDGVRVTGVLKREGNKYLFYGRSSQENSKRLHDISFGDFGGTIGAEEVCFYNSLLRSISSTMGAEYCNIIIEPDTIIIGRNNINQPNVFEISSSMEALANFFSKRINPFEPPNLQNPNQDQDAIEAKDTDGVIRVQRGLSFETSNLKVTYTLLPQISYKFSKPTTLSRAISHLAMVRNLFSIFADRYLPMDEFTFSDVDSKEFDGIKIEDVYALSNYSEINLASSDRYPLLFDNDIRSSFQSLWDNWQRLYREKTSIPALFYEVKTNRSRGINEMLNLTQALEIYSRHFRNSAAERIANTDIAWSKRKAKNKTLEPWLKHRILDLIQSLPKGLKIKEQDAEDLSRVISSYRNYFTHDDKSNLHVSWDVLFCINHFLQFVFLTVIFNHLGIAESVIIDCSSRVYYRGIFEDIPIICENKIGENGLYSF